MVARNTVSQADLRTDPTRDRFFVAYLGRAPWDVGHPQEAFLHLADTGVVRGRVLDVGCGTGENALLFAGRGHDVWGVDMVPFAISQARSKARDRGLGARFRVADALELEALDRTFDTVIDSGLFHVFSDDDRPRFVASLERVLRPGGRYVMLCFSDAQPGDEGPRRVHEDEIRASFGPPWQVLSIEPTRFQNTIHDGGARAWLAVIEYRGRD